jgi:hypothetical protein
VTAVATILNTNATILCSHGGRVILRASQTGVVAGESPVLCVPDLVGASIVGCPVPNTRYTSPCTLVITVFPASWSGHVTVNERPVYIATVAGITNGRPPGALSLVFAGQTIAED